MVSIRREICRLYFNPYTQDGRAGRKISRCGFMANSSSLWQLDHHQVRVLLHTVEENALPVLRYIKASGRPTRAEVRQLAAFSIFEVDKPELRRSPLPLEQDYRSAIRHKPVRVGQSADSWTYDSDLGHREGTSLRSDGLHLHLRAE